MREHIDKLPLFSNLSKENKDELILKSKIYIKSYNKEQIVFFEGEKITDFGIILSGKVYIEKEDINGNITIVGCIKPYHIFAEAFACAEHKSTVNVRTESKTEILWISYKSLLSDEISSECKGAILSNLLKASNEKNIFLTSRIEHLTKRTLREKILSYLNSRSKMLGSKSFTIPYDRNALADFLGADRSALSAVLCKMRNDGEINFKKNKFTLLK